MRCCSFVFVLLFLSINIGCHAIEDDTSIRYAKLSKLASILPKKTDHLVEEATLNVTTLNMLSQDLEQMAEVIMKAFSSTPVDTRSVAALLRALYGTISLFQNQIEAIMKGLAKQKLDFDKLAPLLVADIVSISYHDTLDTNSILASIRSVSSVGSQQQTATNVQSKNHEVLEMLTRTNLADTGVDDTTLKMILRAWDTVINECPRDADDCFDTAYEHFKADNYTEAMRFYEAAWFRWNRTEGSPTGRFTDALIIDYISYCEFRLGNGKRAVRLAEFLLNQHHDVAVDKDWVTRLRQNIPAYRNTRTQQITNMTDPDGSKDDSETDKQRQDRAEMLMNGSDYKHCKFKNDPQQQEPVFTFTSQGFCRRSDRGRSPYLLLQPIKEEVFKTDPVVVLFHDLISDNEIEQMKAMGESKMESAGVVDSRDHQTVIHKETRRAKTAWFDDETSPRLAQRIMEYTALNMVTSEMFQLGAYNVSGHYVPHYDLLFYSPYIDNDGDRIATLLIYMNEVDIGGETVFPRIGTLVEPVKGSAVFWYNQQKNTQDDLRSLHAACPVMSGQKWVINKWFRQGGQEFTRPCGLTPNEVFTLEDFDHKYNVVQMKTPIPDSF